MPTTTHPAPAPIPAGPRSSTRATVASVGALVLGLGATCGLLVLAVALSLCGLAASSEDCSDEQRAAWVALAGAGIVFLGVPALVAALRRDARWLLVPLCEAAVVGLCLLPFGL